MSEPAEPVPQARATSETKYTDMASLRTFVLGGDVMLIKASYFLELGQSGQHGTSGEVLRS